MKIVDGIHISSRKKIQYNGYSFPDMSIDSIPIYSDKNGKLWAEHIPEFNKDTLKILVDEDGMITSYSYDVTSIGLPITTSTIVEIDPSKIPSTFLDLKTFTNWAWNEKDGIHDRVLSMDETIQVNNTKKTELTKQILNEIVKLQVLEKYNMLNSTDSERLAFLEITLIGLSNIDVEDPNAQWPTI